MATLQIFLPFAEPITHDIVEEKVTVGRLADNTLQLDDASISSHHAEIVFKEDAHHLHDLGSTNGTFLNGEQVKDTVLRHGDEIRFGVIEAVFHSEEESSNQELPESSMASAETARTSTRPATFVSSSPLPKNRRNKDLTSVLLIAGAVVSILAFGAAMTVVLGMSAPL